MSRGRKLTYDLTADDLLKVKEALGRPGAVKGDACQAVGIPRTETETLNRALDRLGIEIVLTLRYKRQSVKKVEGIRL